MGAESKAADNTHNGRILNLIQDIAIVAPPDNDFAQDTFAQSSRRTAKSAKASSKLGGSYFFGGVGLDHVACFDVLEPLK
jgi:hypothetical protein